MAYETSPTEFPAELEKLFKPQYFLILLSFGLYLDGILSIGYERNLLSFRLDWAEQGLPVGQILLLFMSFSLFHVGLYPLITRLLLTPISIWVVSPIVSFVQARSGSTRVLSRERGYIHDDWVRDYAVSRGDDVLFSYYREHRRRQDKLIEMFSTMCSVGIMLLGYTFLRNTSLSALNTAYVGLPDIAYTLILTGVALVLMLPLLNPLSRTSVLYLGDPILQKEISDFVVTKYRSQDVSPDKSAEGAQAVNTDK